MPSLLIHATRRSRLAALAFALSMLLQPTRLALHAQTRVRETDITLGKKVLLHIEAQDEGRVKMAVRQSYVELSCAESPNEVLAWAQKARSTIDTTAVVTKGEVLRLRSDIGLGCHALIAREIRFDTSRLVLLFGGPDELHGVFTPITPLEGFRLIRVLSEAAESTRAMSSRRMFTRGSTTSDVIAPSDAGESQTYFEFQVEKRVAPMPGNPYPRYPDMLRSANVEGEVLAQFVVDTTGRAEMSTFKVLKSSHDLFTNAVRNALSNMRFYPAEVDGRKVKQLVQMPFPFSLSGSE